MQAFDLIGPIEVFAAASDILAHPVYQVVAATLGGGERKMSCGIAVCTEDLRGIKPRAGDTVIVAGGSRVAIGNALADPALVTWLRTAGRVVSRVASVCSGAFVLAAAGILAGKRAATHWSGCATLAAQFPTVAVDMWLWESDSNEPDLRAAARYHAAQVPRAACAEGAMSGRCCRSPAHGPPFGADSAAHWAVGGRHGLVFDGDAILAASPGAPRSRSRSARLEPSREPLMLRLPGSRPRSSAGRSSSSRCRARRRTTSRLGETLSVIGRGH